MSRRHFTRTFRTETGQSPARAIESLRVEAAKMLIGESDLSMDAVARETGFPNAEQMRLAFKRLMGLAPQTLRRLGKQA